MFDFSLPPATGVLPIEGHDLLAPTMPINHFSTLVYALTRTSYSGTDSPALPQPATKYTIMQANLLPDGYPLPPPPTK